MKAEKELKVYAPLEAFRPGDFIRVCSPYDCVYTDTYLVVGSNSLVNPLRLVSTRDWMEKTVVLGISDACFDSVDIEVRERSGLLVAKAH